MKFSVRHCKVLSQNIFPGGTNILMFLCTEICTPSDSTETQHKRWLEQQNSVTDCCCDRPRVFLYSGLALRMLTHYAWSVLLLNGSANHVRVTRRNSHCKFRDFFVLFYILNSLNRNVYYTETSNTIRLLLYSALVVSSDKFAKCLRIGRHSAFRVSLIVATIYLQLIQNRYMFRSFTVLQCSHQHCVQPVASDVEVVGYL